jgi:hypothetical protein
MKMPTRKPTRGEGALGTIVALVILVAVAIALFKIVPLHIAGSKVLDAMNEQANFAGVKPLDKIQYEIFVVAQEAGTPVTLQDIQVRRSGAEVIVQLKYEQSVKVLGYNYVYLFDKTVQKPIF